MAKDPAVLFYTSDFLSGTAFFTKTQRGEYITLLCEQHQLWSIPEEHLIEVCGSLESPVIKKFIKDTDGTWYNDRMRKEAVRRKAFCESRRESISKRYTSTTHVDDTKQRMETETETKTKSIKGESTERGITDPVTIVNLWNAFAAANNLSMVKQLSKGRIAKLKTRNFGSETFNDILKHIKCSDFCLGKKTDWKASFDWVIDNDTNYLKILEGKYEGGSNANNGKSGVGSHGFESNPEQFAGIKTEQY